MAGKVYLVGAGPGDSGLITVRGLQLLRRAEVVVYDYLASPRLLKEAPANAELIYVGKQASRHTMSQEEINQLLVARGRGQCVVRLKGGDPFVFGRGGEEALALAEAGIAFEVVPGVTAGVAAAACAGIPVTHRELASCLGLVTGHETPDKAEPSLDFAALAAWGGTLAFYMGVANLEHICRELIASGKPPQTPAAVIRWGATPRQQVLRGSLADLGEKVKAADFKPPAIIVVGSVVGLREKLNWFESRPLFGRRVVVTRSRPQASQLVESLEELGAEAIEFPVIKIEPVADDTPLREAITAMAAGQFDWTVFTSANGVEAVFDVAARMHLDARVFAGVKVAAIGPATAEALQRHGIVADLQPDRFISSCVVEALAKAESLSGKRILCPRADIAPKQLVDDLQKLGAIIADVAAYRTVADASNAEEVAQQIRHGGIDWITFTSSSTVENFIAAIGSVDATLVPKDFLAGIRLASIGPSTSAALRKFCLEPTAEAKNFSIPGLLDAMIDYDGTKPR